MTDITEEEKKRRKRDLTGKIVGGLIVAGGLFLAFGGRISDHVILPFQYKAKMAACLKDEARLKAEEISTLEEKICFCANDPDAKPPSSMGDISKVSAWNSAKLAFTKKAKRDAGISDKILLCEARDFIDRISETK